MGRNGLAEIRRLSITPTAKRNSYRVAILVGQLPRVAGHARNPGLCNRNSYRVAAADGWPLPGPRGELERGFGVLSPVPLHKARGHPPLSSYLVWTAGEGPSVFIVLDYGHPV